MVEILPRVIADVHHRSIVVGAHVHRDVDQEHDREVLPTIHDIGTVATRDQAQAVLDSNICTYKARTEFDQTQFILVGRLNILSKTFLLIHWNDWEVYALKTIDLFAMVFTVIHVSP